MVVDVKTSLYQLRNEPIGEDSFCLSYFFLKQGDSLEYFQVMKLLEFKYHTRKFLPCLNKETPATVTDMTVVGLIVYCCVQNAEENHLYV